MGATEDLLYVGSRLDTFGETHYRMGVAALLPGSPGVPREMWAGEVNSDEWVEWKLLPSTVKESELDALEAEFGFRMPPLFRAYFLSRFQLFNEVHSAKYPRSSVFMPEVPSSAPLKDLRDILRASRQLLQARYAAFATWNDGWGPMCFDLEQQRQDGECPIVWMDHELLEPLGLEGLENRAKLLPLVRPLYDSFRELFEDLFPELPADR
jgi:hypothetical protein